MRAPFIVWVHQIKLQFCSKAVTGMISNRNSEDMVFMSDEGNAR
jgi:hypothetical protein